MQPVRPIHRFRLEQHEGPYESWPVRSRLFDGELRTEVCLAGYELLHQFEVADGYLLIADYDCPFEESTSFTLLSPSLQVLANCSIGAPYASFLLTSVEWVDDRRFRAGFAGGPLLEFTIRSWGIPVLRPRLTYRRAPPFRVFISFSQLNCL